MMRRLPVTLSATLALVLACASTSGAQRASSAEADVRVSAQVISSCRVSNGGGLVPVSVDCAHGTAVVPRIQLGETTRGPVHVIHF